MQQRRLRLGDILDDYCPRERRITNHAIVAMIDDEVKQTRCTTCDADHEYKQARVPPPRRKKESLVAPTPQETTSAETFAESVPVEEAPLPEEPVVRHAEEVPTAVENENENENELDESPAEDEGPVHRRLIRATLPRPEGQPPERKPPEFTRPGSRGREFNGNRAGGGGGQRHARGRRAARGAQGSFGGSSRFGTPRPNSPHGGQRQNGNRPGPGGGQRGGRPQGQSRGPGRKRGR